MLKAVLDGLGIPLLTGPYISPCVTVSGHLYPIEREGYETDVALDVDSLKTCDGEWAKMVSLEQEQECRFPPSLMDPWIEFVANYSGPLYRVASGYEKYLIGDGFKTFEVGMYACKELGIYIEITGLEDEHRAAELEKLAKIIALVSPDQLGDLRASFIGLGKGLNWLEAKGPDGLDINADATVQDNGKWRIFVIAQMGP